MNRTFHPIDLAQWPRREEFEFFSNAGCGFTVTADIDITRLLPIAKAAGAKLYPLLAAGAMQSVNRHREFRYGMEDGTFGWYEISHPLIFDGLPSGNVRCLCAEYHADTAQMLAEIEAVRAQYAGIDTYRPQGEIPPNSVNISCIPWVNFTGMSFSLQYAAYYYPPMIVFGKYREQDGKLLLPTAVNCNHAVNDGGHCALLFEELQQFADSVTAEALQQKGTERP